MVFLLGRDIMRFATLAFAVALATPPAWSASPCIDACKALVDEGNVLFTQGQPQKGLEKYKAAMATSPEASLPLLMASSMLLDLSWRADAAQAVKLQDMAGTLARQALRLAPDDAMAQDLLRQLRDGQDIPLHKPTAAADQAMRQAETLFVQHRFDDARKQYEAASALDPLWSKALVGAGDCYYMQQDWQHAEAQFRRATEIEARNDQAWRFLSDSLAKQGKNGAAEQALYGALAANPAERNTWSKLASLRAHVQLPLKSLHLQRGSRVTVGADGKYTVGLEAHGLQGSTPDTAFALTLAMAEIKIRTDDVKGTKPAYQVELESWRTALHIADETAASSGKGLADPALLQMQALAKEGQLEPALLILTYRPRYRAAFDAWLAAHPDGVKTFIDRYGLQP